MSWDSEGRGNVKFCRDCCQAQLREDAAKAQSVAGMEEGMGFSENLSSSPTQKWIQEPQAAKVPKPP